MYELSLVATTGVYSLLAVHRLLTAVTSLVAEHGLWVHGCSNVTDRLSCPLVCGIFLDQGWKPCLLIGRQVLNHWTTGEVPDRILIEIVIAYITILECEVKWPLGSITMNKACGGDGILAELFQILKDDIAKVPHSICSKSGKLSRAAGLEKTSFHSNPKERQCQGMFRLPHNCSHLTH